MANLITHSLQYSRQQALEYFLKPLFTGDDIRSICTLRTGVAGNEKLDFFTKLEKITKAYVQGTGFASANGVTMVQKEITVARMKAQVEQSGAAFFNSVKEEALRLGVNWDNIDGTVFLEIVAALFVRALRRDLQRQLFFGDKLKEGLTAGASNGTADADYNTYDGFWTRIIADYNASKIPAGQRITMGNGAVAQVNTYGLSGVSAGTVTLTINGIAYSAAYSTNNATTVSNWIDANAAALALRDITATSSSTVITLTSRVPGKPFTVVMTSAGTGGSWAQTLVTPNTPHSQALIAGRALDIFNQMYTAAPYELLDEGDDLRLMVTRSLAANYRASLQTLSGTDAGAMMTINGVPRLTWNGIPLIVRPDWDLHIANDFGGVRPHRALLTTPKNLVVATDLADPESSAEMWYEKKEQTNYMRVQYKVGTQYLHEELIVGAW